MLPYVIVGKDVPIEFMLIVGLVGKMFEVLPEGFGEGDEPVSCHVLAQIVAELGRVEDCLRTGLHCSGMEHSWLEFKLTREYDIVLDVYGVCRFPPVGVVLLTNYGESRRQFLANGEVSITSHARHAPTHGHQLFGTSIFKVDVNPEVSRPLVTSGIEHLQNVCPNEVHLLRDHFAALRQHFYKPPPHTK